MNQLVSQPVARCSKEQKKQLLNMIDTLDLPRNQHQVLKTFVQAFGVQARISRIKFAELVRYSERQLCRLTTALADCNLLIITERFRKPAIGHKHRYNDWNQYTINVSQLKKQFDRIKNILRRQQDMGENKPDPRVVEALEALNSLGCHDVTNSQTQKQSKDLRNIQEEDKYIPAGPVDQKPVTRAGLFDWVFKVLRHGREINTAKEHSAAEASFEDYMARAHTPSYVRALEFVRTGLQFHREKETDRLFAVSRAFENRDANRQLHDARIREKAAIAEYLRAKAGKLEAWAMSNDTLACHAWNH